MPATGIFGAEGAEGTGAEQASEGLRKVHFKAGINRLLYRVENGNDKTEFPLVVSLQP